ncbi:unnamed protein product, partial [Symbiodinium sp. CCMP2592]
VFGRGMSSCNSRIKLPVTIPIYFHNGSSYDFHYIMKYFAHLHGREDSDEYAEFVKKMASFEIPEDQVEEENEVDPGEHENHFERGEVNYYEDLKNPWTTDLRKIRQITAALSHYDFHLLALFVRDLFCQVDVVDDLDEERQLRLKHVKQLRTSLTDAIQVHVFAKR